jgi:predicted acylesterase/phospholipase RssA
MKILFVMSGGGPAGIDIGTGTLKALQEAGFTPTHWSGTSAGAIVSAWCSSIGYNTSKLEVFVRSLDDSLLEYRNLWWLREAWIGSIMSNVKIKNALKTNLPSTIPSNVHLWATRCKDLKLINVADQGLADLPTAALASMSIRGIWPATQLLDGTFVIDGGFRKNLPYMPYIFPDFDQVWLLVSSGKPVICDPIKVGLLGIARDDISMLVENSTLTTIEDNLDNPKVRVICPMVDSPSLSFDHSLINKAYEEAKKQIKIVRDNNSADGLRACKQAIIDEYKSYRNI